MQIKVSVVICSYNREKFIDRAIDSLARQSFDSKDFEIIVVDNASTDKTADIVKGLVPRTSNLRYVFEAQQGLSYARNRGVHEARAPLVAFLDDDAYADSHWLLSIVSFFESAPQKVAAVGGKCLAVWNIDIPKWLDFNGVSGPLAVMNYGIAPQNITRSSRVLFGANMAFRREALLSVGGFDVQLGRVGKKLLSGEDSVIQWKLDDQGYERWYRPEIFVWHNVPVERMMKDYHCRWHAGFGISWAVMRQYKQEFSFLMRVFLVVSILFRGALRLYTLLAWVWPCSEKYRFQILCWWLAQWGYFRGVMGWM